MKEKGVTGKKLAELTGINEVTISRVITGKTGTTLTTLIDIANALDVEVRDLFISRNEDPIYVKKGDTYARVGSVKMP